VASPDGRVFINPRAIPECQPEARGCLTGIIASFIGQGLDPVDAAVAGVYLHGLCGDRVANVKGSMVLLQEIWRRKFLMQLSHLYRN